MWDSFFTPRGVAILGASQTPTKLGYGAARNLVVSGYRGAIHFVNPRPGELFGRPFYPSVKDVPDPVDLAVILIPAESVSRGAGGMRAARDRRRHHRLGRFPGDRPIKARRWKCGCARSPVEIGSA